MATERDDDLAAELARLAAKESQDLERLLQQVKQEEFQMPKLDFPPLPEMNFSMPNLDFPEVDFAALFKQDEVDLQQLLKQMEDSDHNTLEMLQRLEAGQDFTAMFEGVPDVAPADPLPPPDPSLTFEDAARWMRDEVRASGRLHHGHDVRHLLRHFGERFTRRNKGRHRVIALEVLAAFMDLTSSTIVWNRREQFWRMRRPIDPSRREVCFTPSVVQSPDRMRQAAERLRAALDLPPPTFSSPHTCPASLA